MCQKLKMSKLVNKFVIPKELTDLNTFIKHTNINFIVGNQTKRKNTDIATIAVLQAKLKPITEYPVHVEFNWHSSNQKKDIDNVAFAKKFILDGMVEAKFIENDSRKFVSSFSDNFYIDKDNPRIEVVVYKKE